MTSTMTRKQRNALKTIPGVTITSGREVEIFIDNGEGRADDDATEAVLVKVAALIGWGGYRSGYGSWVLRAGYAADTADYCDPSARCHY
tara:strand:+ start:2609 stop:2875 length:267 start_codon:yes stop_codon:yes gene_type:complete